MAVHIPFVLLAMLLTSPAMSAEDSCPKHFEDYGLFLQAKQSCGGSAAYPKMAIMKACAAATPKDTAIALMDAGRRAWARSLMRSSLGTRCDEVFSKPPVSAATRTR